MSEDMPTVDGARAEAERLYRFEGMHVEAGHDLSLAPHYPGPGKWCEACPIPQPLSDATDGREGA